MEITFHKERGLMWRMRRETKEALLARQHEEHFNFESQQLEEKAEFAKGKVASPSKQNVKLL